MNSNWSNGPETAKWGYDLCDLDHWPLTLTVCMDITSVIGNNLWNRWTDAQIDRQTDWTIHWAAWSQLKIKENDISIIQHRENKTATINSTKPNPTTILKISIESHDARAKLAIFWCYQMVNILVLCCLPYRNKPFFGVGLNYISLHGIFNNLL